jgi:predicted secreted hydrolase
MAEQISADRIGTVDWKRYPFWLVEGDTELLFPQAEGDQGAASNTYYVAGRLRGRASGHRWAFLVIFAFNDVWHRQRADFHTIALFDLETGGYGTSTEFDLPRLLRRRTSYRSSVVPGHLDVSFLGSAGESSWRTRRAKDGELAPFSYVLDALGVDREGKSMRLELDIETRKPPVPIGGNEYRGRKTCRGQYGAHSYFQSDVRFSGRLGWENAVEEVGGDCGWIDRQWAPTNPGIHTDFRGTRYRHERREIHLDSGTELSVWMHFDRRRANRVIPFSGVTAAGPTGEIDATTDFDIERLSFVRDLGLVAARYPLAGPRYFTDRYRLRIRGWDLDLVSEPLVAAPAHALAVEYWNGPTRIQGTFAGRPVSGFGFHERTLVFARDFELVEVLRQTLHHLPADAFVESGTSGSAAANLAWEIDAFLSRRDHQSALRYLNTRVRSEIERLAEPYRDPVLAIVDDTADVLLRWWVRP